MGYTVPPRVPLPWKADPRLWDRWYVADLQRTVRRWRLSPFPWRRRRAYAALLNLIRWREAHIWPETDEPVGPPPPPKPLRPTYVRR